MPKTTIHPDGTVVIENDTVAKQEWDGSTVRLEVIKASDERRFTLSMGYPAYQADVAVARDGHKDFASAEEVEKAAWDYLTSGPEVGAKHKDGTEGAGRIVESYIYRGPDWEVGEDRVVKEGDWLIGTIWTPEAWADIKSGKFRGTSMQGTAARRAPSPLDMPKVKARG